MGEKWHYMTWEERNQLEAYLKAKKTVSWIAHAMGFTRQTIYNEMKRGQYLHTKKWWDEARYSADKGQRHHQQQQTAKGRPIKLGKHHDYANHLERLMLGIQPDGTVDRRKRYSPYAALMEADKAGYPIRVCTSTLYSYINKGIFLRLTNKDLWEKPRKKRRGYHHIQRIAHPLLPSIAQRPEAATHRLEPGHQEMDLIVGPTGSRAALLTFTDRYTRRETIIKVPDKTATSVTEAINQLEMEQPNFGRRFATITTDNGPEFLRYAELTTSPISGKQRTEIYYCHSYAAWEKGTNERHNRIIRRWYPKGTDFTKIGQAELNDLTDWMNKYPRRSLNGLSPMEIEQLTIWPTLSPEAPYENKS